MGRIIADFHIHSKYSRATSRNMDVQSLNQWALMKGIDLLGTGDFTHPTYFAELKDHLEPTGKGLFRLKNATRSVQFILTSEVSNIYSDKGKTRRIHTMIFAPSFEVVEKIIATLSGWGKIASDGRPIFGFSVKQLAKMIFNISDECMIIPAHAWTPWFSVFGAQSGYDSLEEAFGEMAPAIRVIETGLSSDPGMNWRLSALDEITLISNSDAHSLSKLGREANIFDCDADYHVITEILKIKDRTRFLKTIEFFPEEGKYHFDGHRNCNVLFSPQETRDHHGICPQCGKPLTVGVMNRIETLSDRPEGYQPDSAIPFVRLVPLQEIISEAMGIGVGTSGVDREYERIIDKGGSEFRVLMDLPQEELATFVSERILEGIIRVREGNLTIKPGYDGVFGEVKIFGEGEMEDRPQMTLF
jgi:uncharacterized protein (TIGR00375 family)